MKKYVLDLTVVSVERIHARYVLIRLTDAKPLPDMLPGQFVEVRVDGSPSTFLRRPISINYVDRAQNQLWLLVATVGEGTKTLATLQPGAVLNCVLPLGNGFTSASSGQKVLLVGIIRKTKCSRVFKRSVQSRKTKCPLNRHENLSLQV